MAYAATVAVSLQMDQSVSTHAMGRETSGGATYSESDKALENTVYGTVYICI